MTNEAIQALTKDIEAQEDALDKKRELLKAMKKDAKKQVPFGRTTFGKAYFGTIRAITSPFASLHQRADDLINKPEQVRAEKLLHRSDKLLKACEKLENREHKKAPQLAIACAMQVMEIETFLEANEELPNRPELAEACVHLDDQVQRLRPPKDEKKAEDLKEQVEEQLRQAQLQGA
jgi:hypothetical protein